MVGGLDESCCPTCLEEWCSDNPPQLLPCGHAFHLACTLAWSEVGHRDCPLCGAPVDIEEVLSQASELAAWGEAMEAEKPVVAEQTKAAEEQPQALPEVVSPVHADAPLPPVASPSVDAPLPQAASTPGASSEVWGTPVGRGSASATESGVGGGWHDAVSRGAATDDDGGEEVSSRAR